MRLADDLPRFWLVVVLIKFRVLILVIVVVAPVVVFVLIFLVSIVGIVEIETSCNRDDTKPDEHSARSGRGLGGRLGALARRRRIG